MIFTRFGVQTQELVMEWNYVAYIFNPYSSSYIYYFINQHSGQGSLGGVGMKGLGIKTNSSITGMNLYPASGNF